MEKIYDKDMLLESVSGFSMPYGLEDNEDAEIMLGFGNQTHPMTGEKFNHQGVDLACKEKQLYAIATGAIIGAGQNSEHGYYIVARYGKYEVTYGHISEAYKNYGEKVSAGEIIAKSGDFLHLGVRFDGRVASPMDFLGMVYANIQQLRSMGIEKMPSNDELGGKKFKSPYDDAKEDIMTMMLRFLPNYFSDLQTGAYAPPSRVENSLRNIFQQAAQKEYFFETMPNLGNPLGLGARSVPLVEKIQMLLLNDFLSYMALTKGYLPQSWGDEQKKNFLSKLPLTA